jgi:glyoxylase-like metal-dependent hydrolase (beta-lactamase superfamily II)
MQILRRLYQVSGDLNGVTWDGINAAYHDATTYVLERPDGLIPFDCGCGDTMDQLLANLRYWNLDADRIRDWLLTHPHGDHAGGGHLLKQRHVQLLASPEEALNEALMQWR